MPLVQGGKPFPFVETPFTETQGQFSPDGKWIAYSSNESGRMEVYAAPFPGSGSRWRVSPPEAAIRDGHGDGTEIFYLAPGNVLTSAEVSSQGSNLVVGDEQSLFAIRLRPQVRLDAFPYDVSSDGQRFLVNSFVEETASTAITLMLNWTEGIGQVTYSNLDRGTGSGIRCGRPTIRREARRSDRHAARGGREDRRQAARQPQQAHRQRQALCRHEVRPRTDSCE